MTVKCPKCHYDNPTDTRFCGNCATPLPATPGKTPEALTKTIGEISWDLAKGTLLPQNIGFLTSSALAD